MVKRKTIQRAALSAALSLCIAGGAYAHSTLALDVLSKERR